MELVQTLPSYLKFIYKFIDKSQKEQKQRFIELSLSFLEICCAMCLKTLKDPEKIEKICKNCFPKISSEKGNYKNLLLTKYFNWRSNEESKVGNLLIKVKAIEYFGVKLNYVPNFSCYFCHTPFDYQKSLPIQYNEGSIEKAVCFKCSMTKRLANQHKIYLYEFSRLCVKKCGNPGELLLECSHSVCFECSTGSYFVCCNIVTFIEDNQKFNEKYFYLCDAHKIPADLYSEETLQVYCKLCEPLGETYKISENFQNFSTNLFSISSRVPISSSKFMKKISSEKYNICKSVREDLTRIIFYEKIIPENKENFSQMWMLSNFDTHIIEIEVKPGKRMVINGLFITGCSENSDVVIKVQIKKNGYDYCSLYFELMSMRCQLLEFPKETFRHDQNKSMHFLNLEKNDKVEFRLSYSRCFRTLCYSGVIPKFKNKYISVTVPHQAGLIYGLSIMAQKL
jgi:hypothetical protein